MLVFIIFCVTLFEHVISSFSPSSYWRENEGWEGGLAPLWLLTWESAKPCSTQRRQNHLSRQLMASCRGMVVLLCRGTPRLPLCLMIHWRTHRSQKWFITARGYRLNSAKGKGAWDEIQEKPGTSFQVSSSSDVAWMCLIFPAMCYMCQVLPTRGAHLSLGVM